MKLRTVYVSHSEGIGTFVTITRKTDNKERKRSYKPGKLSLRRMESFLVIFQPDHANFSPFHASATWSFKQTNMPWWFTEQPEVELCSICGLEPEYLYDGLCSPCHNSDKTIEAEYPPHGEQ